MNVPKLPYSFHDSRSEEHTSELQSHDNLVCRLLLEKKKKKNVKQHTTANTTCERRYTYNTRARVVPATSCPPAHRSIMRRSFFVLCFFFFKGTGPPKYLPFPPTRPFPI